MVSELKNNRLDRNLKIPFAELFHDNKISSCVKIQVYQDIVSAKDFVFASFDGSVGYNYNFMIMNSLVKEEYKSHPFASFTIELALSGEFSPKDGWVELKAEVETKNDSRYLELNLYDLRVIVPQKWIKVEFVFPKPVIGEEIKMIRLVLNSKNDLNGGIFLKEICLNKVCLELSVDKENPDRNSTCAILDFLSIKKLNKFAIENNIRKVLIIAKEPEEIKREWEGIQDEKIISFIIRYNEMFNFGQQQKNSDPLLGLSRMSKQYDYRHLMGLFDDNDQYWEEWCDGPVTVEKIFSSNGVHKRLDRLTENVDFALIQGSDLFDELLIKLNYISSMIKKDGYLAVWDTALPAASKAIEFFDNNRGEEFCRVTNKNCDSECVVWQRTMHYDPRSWDHFIEF